MEKLENVIAVLIILLWRLSITLKFETEAIKAIKVSFKQQSYKYANAMRSPSIHIMVPYVVEEFRT